VRWAAEGRGKSGGYRTIYYYHDDETPLVAFVVYAKGKRTNLTAAEIKAFGTIISAIKAEIRKGKK
jgi:hypothetical protein